MKDFSICLGDHSSLLNSGVLLYTVKVIFSDCLFFTADEEMLKSELEENVQGVVEPTS